MPVNNQHDDFKRMVERWIRCRDVMEGQDSVHAAGNKYLPRLKEQTDDDYLAYLRRTPFYNATWRTIAGLVGMLFRKPPVVKVPPAVEDLLEDVTMTGTPLHMFVQEVCNEALGLGRLGILVDYPAVDPLNLTQADAKRLNLRPTMAIFRAESVINWRMDRVNNIWTLVQVVLKECANVPTDEFTQKKEERFRVLDLLDNAVYRVRLFRMNGDQQEQLGGDVFPKMSGKPMHYIPFTFLSTEETGHDVDDPPLIDLVDVNLSHFRTSADLEHGAHFTGLPTAWIAGYRPEKEGEKMYIGSQAAWIFPDTDAKAEFLEFKGEGLGSLERLKESKERQMAILGARMLEQQKKATETADSQSIQRKGEESMLSAASQAISLGIERALRWFSAWAGADVTADDAVEFELNREFYAQPMTDKMLSSLVSAWQQGAISFQTLFDNLQFGDVIDQDKTPEEEQAQIGDTPPALQGQNVDPVTGEPKAPQPLPKGKKKVTGPDGRSFTVEEQ